MRKPDGYLDAPLGPLGYRVMLECKSARGAKVTQPDGAAACRWEREHGRAKRVRVIAEMLVEIGWSEQRANAGA